MREEDRQEQSIISYLLGQATEAEQSRIEGRYFQDPEFHERILATEEELIRQYLHGELSREQNRLFEGRVLSSARFRRKYEFTQSLIAKADEAAVFVPRKVVDSTPAGWWSWLTFSRPKTAWSMVCVLIVLFGGVWWLTSQSDKPSEQRNEVAVKQPSGPEQQPEQISQPVQPDSPKSGAGEIASTPEPTKPQPRATSVTMAFAITFPNTRDPGEMFKIHIPLGCEFIQLQVPLLNDDGYQRYEVSIKTTDGEQVVNLKNLKKHKFRSGQIVLLTLPVSSLKDGEYALGVSGTTESGQSKLISETFLEVKKD